MNISIHTYSTAARQIIVQSLSYTQALERSTERVYYSCYYYLFRFVFLLLHFVFGRFCRSVPWYEKIVFVFAL